MRTTPPRTGLVWFRTGLRLHDNTCLFAALQENEQVYALYVLDDTYLRGPDIGAARVAFLFDALHKLQADIESYGGQLIVRRVKEAPQTEIIAVAKEVGARAIYLNRDYLPYPLQRDRHAKALAEAEGIAFKTYPDILLVEPDRVKTETGQPYQVFTPFKRRWENLMNVPERYPLEPLLGRLRVTHRAHSTPIPTLAEYGLTLRQQIEPAGERRALQRLEAFACNGLPYYHQRRDFAADPDSTSRLSMHIKWGTISIRECYRTARKVGGPGAQKWIDELAWREFYHAVLYYFPHALTGPMHPEYDRLPWSEDEAHFEAWKAGMTGYPFVDAGMRQLNQTGWMHNRLRQVVASYLCKDLLIHWQKGERYFMQMLVDGDWPANNGGWQWVAGTGTDPRRATRIFNPVLQQERYDPQMDYIRQWVPEFGSARYPTKPIVPHEEGRQRFLNAFKAMTGKAQDDDIGKLF